MTTKERIVDEALSLFSVKGYKGTSVKNIADAVGVKDSSLYKHFASKQEILDTIVSSMEARIASMSEEMGLPSDATLERTAAVFSSFDEAALLDFSRRIFLFYLKDSFVSRFWRMGNIEQFQNPPVYALFSKLFLEDSLIYQRALFAQMIKVGYFIDADPQVMAMSFYAPIFFLLSKYANMPEKEDEALQTLDKQVLEYYRIYRRKSA